MKQCIFGEHLQHGDPFTMKMPEEVVFCLDCAIKHKDTTQYEEQNGWHVGLYGIGYTCTKEDLPRETKTKMEEYVIVWYIQQSNVTPTFFLIPAQCREEFITWVEWVRDNRQGENIDWDDKWDGTDFENEHMIFDTSSILIRDYEQEII